MIKIPCSIVRGGTSKGVFVLEDFLPRDRTERTRLLLRLMGSPDPRQIDGLGGADPLTSKVAIVSRSDREDIDVEYESAEVGIAEATVNLGIMCGNLLSGVGAFAVAEGLVTPQSPLTTVRIYCRSTQKTVVAYVPCAGEGAGGAASFERTTFTHLVFHNPGGAITGRLLPLGEPVTLLPLPDGRVVQVSVVDAGTLYAFVRAEAFGLAGTEDAAALDLHAGFRAAIEAAREEIAGCINRQRFHGVPLTNPNLVKIAIVAPADAGRDGADVFARVINRAKVHKAYAVSGGICLAAAAAIPGTLVNDIAKPAGSPFTLRIGHPSGVLPVLLRWSADDAGIALHAAEVQRGARLIMRGVACVPAEDEAQTVSVPIVAPAGAPGEVVMP
jgi:2-methylaconitate cis-trans-isomerase PrpF